MRAIILVGGEGTRLRPLTYTTPKQMLPVAEVPMIERVVAHLVTHGVSDVILSLGYRPDAFTSRYPDGRCAGATLSYVVEPTLLDTAGAVRFAARASAVEDTFLVVNGDVLSDLDVGELVRFHRASAAEGTIALTPVEDPSAFGVVSCAPDGRVEAFIEKPPPGTALTNLINAGTYVLEASVLDRIAADRRVNIERETFPAMVADGGLYALASDGYWIDVGTPERYVQATTDLLDGTRPGPPVLGAVELAPTVWCVGASTDAGRLGPATLLADGVDVGVGACLTRCVVGTGGTVGAGAVVDGAVLLAGVTVGARARVIDSIVGPGATVGAAAVVNGWSVLGGGANVPEGAELTGTRQPA